MKFGTALGSVIAVITTFWGMFGGLWLVIIATRMVPVGDLWLVWYVAIPIAIAVGGGIGLALGYRIAFWLGRLRTQGRG